MVSLLCTVPLRARPLIIYDMVIWPLFGQGMGNLLFEKSSSLSSCLAPPIRTFRSFRQLAELPKLPNPVIIVVHVLSYYLTSASCSCSITHQHFLHSLNPLDCRVRQCESAHASSKTLIRLANPATYVISNSETLFHPSFSFAFQFSIHKSTQTLSYATID